MVSPQGPSSFIPKSPTAKSTPRPRGIRKIYIFTYLSLVIFFGTLIAAAGTFFFEVTAEANLASQKELLANERNAFNANDLDRLRQLESRINNAKTILNTHVSLSQLFRAIEQSTITTVELRGFKYQRSEVGNIQVSINAVASTLNDARFQNEIFSSNPLLRKAGLNNPTYSTIQQQANVSTNANNANAPAEVTFVMSGFYGVADIPYVPVATAPVSFGNEVDFGSDVDGSGTGATLLIDERTN